MVYAAPSTIVDRDILPFVQRPQRYAGLELNRTVKPDAELRWALAFPDLYEIGMSWLGMQILYHRINSQLREVAAERVFLPEEDAIARFRATGLPLTTLETRTPLNKVDLLGFTLSYEMAMPGVLEMLNLAGIPIHTSERREEDPIVLAGGPVMFNPEPLADFLDLVVVGEGEEVVLEISRVALRGKREGWSRDRMIRELADLEGLYRPSAYTPVEGPDGRLLVSPDPKAIPLVRGLTVPELLPEYYPDKPLLPLAEVTFDRVSLEVMRGCTRGCRFCQAGTLYRPVRERSVDDILAQAIANIAATGHEEISLTSLSTSDYGPLPELIPALRDTFRGKGISLAFPSLRPDSFTPEMARAFPDGRKGGITFAPEAGTQRLRDIINKNSREEDLLRATTLAFGEGYNSVKLYFMIGLPGERDEDLVGIADLAAKVAKTRTRNGQKVTVSVSPFAPKPHTPFQRIPQNSTAEFQRKLDYLRQQFRGVQARYNGHDPASALFESALARGDRRLGEVIERVWRNGGMLEAWNDRFNPERWHQAYRDSNLDPTAYVAAIPGKAALPWGHISKGVTERFQEVEMTRSLKLRTTPDCRQGRCQGCGLERFIPEGQKVCNIYPASSTPPSPAETHQNPAEVVNTARLRYRRGASMRWTGHLDLVRIWTRLLRRAEVPVAFSQGFHPHPRISFSPPLPVGMQSEDEYIDIDLAVEITADELFKRLCRAAPDDLEPVEVVLSSNRLESLAGRVRRMEYLLPVEGNGSRTGKLTSFLASESVPIRRVRGKKVRDVDLRPFVEMVDPDDSPGWWRVRLVVDNGATARLEELGEAWGLDMDVQGQAVRAAMLVECDKGWCRPIDAVQNEVSRAKGVVG